MRANHFSFGLGCGVSSPEVVYILYEILVCNTHFGTEGVHSNDEACCRIRGAPWQEAKNIG
jgi:hypothetical protein